MKQLNGFAQPNVVLPVVGPARFALGRSAAIKVRKSMQRRWLSVVSSLLFALCAVVLGLASKAWGDTVLYNFAGPTGDGAYAIGTPIHDKYGNLYGTTDQGGLYGYGTVFVLCAPGAASPDLYPCTTSLASWTEFVLYNFKGPSSGGDGANPRGTLVFNGLYAGRSFTLYGTTYNGGNPNTCSANGTKQGCGTVFELCAPSNFGGCGGVNVWKEKVLHRFLGGTDGALPFGGLISDKASDVFGTTVYGGHLGTCKIGSVNNYCGTVFKLKGQSPWTFPETILHRFKGSPDGANPYATLCCNTIYAIPYLYGTTVNGGTSNLGAVFKVKNSGAFPTTVLYNFSGTPDGANPYGDVIFDASGNLYSTTSAGGANSMGTVFELLSPSLTTESVLYSFCPISGCADGATPYAGLTFDTAGNLYGTTYSGGTGCGGTCGTVFELVPSWTESVLWSFTGGATDGSSPFAGVTFDTPISPSNLYGATRFSGTSSFGVIYSVP